MGLDQPLTRSNRFSLSWLRRQKLAIGPMPRREAHWHVLRQQGVRSIFSCCCPDEGIWLPPHDWRAVQFPLPDHRKPKAMTEELLHQALTAALDLYKEAPPLYLHCWAGMERSPLLAVGLLCRSEGLNLFDALAEVRLQHPISQPLISHLVIMESLTSASKLSGERSGSDNAESGRGLLRAGDQH